MIKKLKLKFLIIFMGITTMTLLGVFIFVGISTYHSYEKNCQSALTRALTDIRMNNPAEAPANSPGNEKNNDHTTSDKPERDPGEKQADNPPNEPAPPGERRDTSIIFTARYSDSQGILKKDSNEAFFTLSDEETEKLVANCIQSGKEYGKIKEYSLAYMYRKGKTDTTIAFFDTSNTEHSMRMLIITFCIAGLCGIVLFYFLSLFLSRWCIRPIERVWTQQKNFVADASHELKTPLTVILANASLLRECLSRDITDGTEYGKYLDYIGDEANHMSRLVNDMLFLARADARREEEEKQTVDFSDICLNTCLSFESVAYEQKITLETDLEENLSVNGIPEKLSQLCAILLDNACKYTEPGGTIRASLYHKGNHITWKVNNSGAPIAKEQLEHLFDRFYRADESRTRKKNSYGLGLSIAKQIAELHNAKIEVSSTVSGGTTFTVRFFCQK